VLPIAKLHRILRTRAREPDLAVSGPCSGARVREAEGDEFVGITPEIGVHFLTGDVHGKAGAMPEV